ncbi:MAG: hypothetical protein ACP5XB_02075 [Isosphaeraceae bacterium]
MIGDLLGRQQDLLALAILLAGLLAWLWPIGLGGKMPVGGDVTQFFIGLMGVLSRSLAAGRLPLWNDLWGFGFPGIGESQMGVYYPPHVLLYGALRGEWAYVASLVLHTLWGGLGTFWATRKFGVSPTGALLAALAFSGSGFFVIHLPHPWGYTTGSWMPWAWGLAWLILAADASSRTGKVFLLSLVLVLQILPGHFQLAFLTQAGIALLALWFLVDPAARLSVGSGQWEKSRTEFIPVYASKSRTEFIPCSALPPVGGGQQAVGGRRGAHSPLATRQSPLRRALPLAVCLAMVFPLAALQLWPTARLARLAADQRDFDYLSLCAATPLHLVNLVAPGLFHRSTLWRPLVWTPLHTSPEELLVYVGLVPLFLAILELRHAFRRDPVVRLLALLAAVSLYFSLGPFVPGFRLLIALPGFSFFRAPARWTLVTSLALAILAGKGLDRCRQRPDTGRSLLRLAGLAAAWIALALVLIELAILGSSTRDHPWLAGLLQKAIHSLPWSPELPSNAHGFLQSRGSIYVRELAATAGLLAVVAVVGYLASFRRFRGHPTLGAASLFVLSFIDLLILGQHRLVEVAPLRPLAEQSPVLARLAEEPPGTRIADVFHNLSMLVGLEPIAAYRTLDLPALGPLARLAQAPLSPRLESSVRQAMRACGVGVRVVDAMTIARERPSRDDGITIDDPALAGWLFGPERVAGQGRWASRFRISHPEPAPSRAWFLPLTAIPRPAMLDSWTGDLRSLLDLFDRAKPLATEARSSERLDVSLDVDGPGWVIVSQLADPQWRAWWSGEKELEGPAEILPTFRLGERAGGWQRVWVPGAGRWTLHLEYNAHDVYVGLLISGVAWLAWGLGLVLSRQGAGSREQ